MPEKSLYLLRHAKSSWDEQRVDDHDRPLAPRGRKATELVAAYMRAHEIAPQLILCSSARRTRETLDGLYLTGEVHIESEIYGAGPSLLLERLHEIPDEVTSTIVIGHNPSLQALALRLAAHRGRPAEGSPRAELERKFPTGGLATLRFSGPWSGLDAGSAELIDFVRPKALRTGAGS